MVGFTFSETFTDTGPTVSVLVKKLGTLDKGVTFVQQIEIDLK